MKHIFTSVYKGKKLYRIEEKSNFTRSGREKRTSEAIVSAS